VKTENNEKKQINVIGNIKASFSGRKFRSGAYTTIISVVVIIMVLVVNLIVTKMNIQFDLSSQSMYTLTKDTKDLVSSLKDDITIYYMVQPGNEQAEFEKIAKLYDKLSNKITLVNKDPVQYPQFASKYVDDTVAENSFIVVNNTNDRAKYIASSDMLIQELDYTTYQYKTTGIDVEGKITSAIQYVTTEDLPIMYTTTGHGEADNSDSFTKSVGKMNINIQTLSTVTQSTIPEDCGILFINTPQSDFSDAETTMIKAYLDKGGKVLVTLDYNASKLPNFLSILDYYGIKMSEGIVLEGDTNKYASGYPHYIIPNIESHDITTKVTSSNVPVFMPISSGLTVSDSKRSSLTVTPLLTTSDSSFSKVNVESTTSTKEDGDISGPFDLGVVSEAKYNDVTSDLVVYSSVYTFADDTATYGNSSLLTGTIGYLAGDMQTLSIPTKSYGDTYVTVTQLQAIMWGAVIIIIIPAFILITGGVICYKRRRK